MYTDLIYKDKKIKLLYEFYMFHMVGALLFCTCYLDDVADLGTFVM